jgi:hypothetical protein
MKKVITILSLCIAFGFTTIQTADNCDKKALSENCKKQLGEFQYDSQKFMKINFTEKVQLLEVEVPVFVGEKYRVVFNTSSLPNQVNVSVYTKDKESKKREAIFSSKKDAAGKTEFAFDAPRVRKMYVDYEIPMIDSKEKQSGCAVFMVGYK